MTVILNFRAPALPLPPADYAQAQQDQFIRALRLYFNRLDDFNNQITTNINIPASGTTAQRPTTGLQIGQVYFDTDLDSPIWWGGVNWVSPVQIINTNISLAGVVGTGSIGTVTIVIV
jgi:hypothetical protein